MNRSRFIANAILWATAIVASAIVGAPSYLSVFILPVLATLAVLMTRPDAPAAACRT